MDNPTLEWRCASSFPTSLDTIFGAAEFIARRVAEATLGRFRVNELHLNDFILGDLPGIESKTAAIRQEEPQP